MRVIEQGRGVLAMKNIFNERRLYKQARELLKHSRYIRQMREDIIPPEQLQQLTDCESALLSAVSSKDITALKHSLQEIDRLLVKTFPPRKNEWLRENLEVFVVAVAVAMGLRAYIIQPFKIPTGSMQPTLYGIHTDAGAQRKWSDNPPFSWVKWLISGESYRTVKARESGILGAPRVSEHDPANIIMYIGRHPHRIPRDSRPNYMPGEYVSKGEVLWSGRTWSGDHVFVDKIRWNFRRPYRGQVVVFTTDNIPTLPEGTHYIKRLIGMPGEAVSIDPPDVIIDARPLRDTHKSIERISSQHEGYDGFLLPEDQQAVLQDRHDRVHLRDNQYFTLGDNTGNSRDSRYWGAVPQDNMVGPAIVVYWPFSRRWGAIR